MEREAKNRKVNLNDGNRHHFRSCYKDENKRKIASEPFSFEDDESSSFLEEIMLVKLSRIWNEIFRS